MRMQKIIKITIVALIIIMAIGAKQNVQAFGDIKQQADNFINMGKTNAVIEDYDTNVLNTLVPIGKILVQIANVVLVIVGCILGIKYMTSGADEKANIKQKLIWYVISIVLVYGAVGIYTLIRQIIDATIG